VARASYVVGTLPRHHLDRAVATGPDRWIYLTGVALMVLAWLALGRLTLHEGLAGRTHRVWLVAAITSLPLLAAAPVTSQDVWAYLGQANLSAHGLDPYSVGPGAVPGPYAHAVAHEWLDAPAPYGPVWLSICRLVVAVTHPHPWAGMFGLRVLALVGTVVLGAGLARLARAGGGRPEVALWLTVAGPFPLLMLLGGVHNDALMLALLVGGVSLAATTRSQGRALLLGASLVGAAAAIKVVALVALPFLPLVWWQYAERRHAAPHVVPHAVPSGAGMLTIRRWLTAGMLTVTAGVVTLLMLGLVTGYGFGWVPHIGDGRIGVRWLSVPQQLGNLAHLVAPDRVADAAPDRYPALHPLGLSLLGAGLVAVLLTARHRPPLRSLAIALLLVVVTSPAPRLWYLLWPLAFLAADRLSTTAVATVAAASATLALWFPASVRPQPPEWLLLPLFAVLLVLSVAATRPRHSVPQEVP
jgi:hypothetical protein